MGSSNYVPFLLVTTTVTAAAISSTEIGFYLTFLHCFVRLSRGAKR